MQSKDTNADMWELVEAVFKLLLFCFVLSKLDSKIISY